MKTHIHISMKIVLVIKYIYVAGKEIVTLHLTDIR